MKTTFAVSIASLLLIAVAASAQTPRRASFDADWRFKLGEAEGADKPELDDSKWRQLDLPHDWMIEGTPGKDPASMEGPFDRKSPGGDGNGYLNGGVGWYHKTFTIPAADKGKHIAIDFDGVYMNSEVWLNGVSLGKHPYGYTSFEYDLTPHLKFGDEKNVIAVRAEVVQPCSRFYSGAGIYRNVWLVTTNSVHVDHWGTYVTTEVKDGITTATAETTVVNDGKSPVSVGFRFACYTGAQSGISGGGEDEPVALAPGASHTFIDKFRVSFLELWSLEHPQQYNLNSLVVVDHREVDEYLTAFGIRTIEFTNDDGFHLNGKRVQIQGVCDHHDLGCLGAAVNRRAIQRQLEILKSFGVNAIRTSHYPPAPELLDLCDEMGFVVMDEAFDEWKASKTQFGYGQFFDEWSERDIVSMVRRDRNHPSIVMWSIGNEIPEQRMKNMGGMATRLVDLVKHEDPTRPTVSAMDSAGDAFKNGFTKPLDILGVNYNVRYYDNADFQGQKPMLGSETSSTVTSRGEYGLTLDPNGKVIVQKETNHQVNSYAGVVPPWATPVETALQTMASDRWMAGEFVWTGFDYLGEPTPFGWPSRSSYFGIVDLAGFPKDRYYLYKSVWRSEPLVHLLPHWNWEQFDGKDISVWCYTNCDKVELFLNDKSLGSKTWRDRSPMHLEWSVPFTAGTLKAIGTTDGKVVATDIVKTASKPAKILLKPDRSEIKPMDRDLSFVTVSVVDADGNICPTAENEITFTVAGPGKIAGLDNGDATNHESFQGNEHRVFNGLGLVVIEAGKSPGEIQLSATAEGLAPASTMVMVK